MKKYECFRSSSSCAMQVYYIDEKWIGNHGLSVCHASHTNHASQMSSHPTADNHCREVTKFLAVWLNHFDLAHLARPLLDTKVGHNWHIHHLVLSVKFKRWLGMWLTSCIRVFSAAWRCLSLRLRIWLLSISTISIFILLILLSTVVTMTATTSTIVLLLLQDVRSVAKQKG